MELAIIGRRAVELLRGRRIKVVRVLSGPLMTSLDMAGFSLSLLLLSPTRKARLDASSSAPAWGPLYAVGEEEGSKVVALEAAAAPAAGKKEGAAAAGGAGESVLKRMVRACAESIVKAEEELTALDEKCGDGDCGVTMRRGAEQVLADLAGYPEEEEGVLSAVASSINESMGGTSGALLEIFFRAAGRTVKEGRRGEAFKEGIAAMEFYGGGRKGFRTMLDALHPACEALGGGGTLEEAAAAAAAGAEETKMMQASAGRANWVDAAAYEGAADPGAMAVAIGFRAMAAVK
uniref:DhaL domain-containing protein n=1 Tax=Guillardia theta TaxID=55529 RepID=A0A7S4NKK8_GUITH